MLMFSAQGTRAIDMQREVTGASCDWSEENNKEQHITLTGACSARPRNAHLVCTDCSFVDWCPFRLQVLPSVMARHFC